MKRIGIYFFGLAVFIFFICLALEQGQKLTPPNRAALQAQPDVSNQDGVTGVESSGSLLANLRANAQEPLTRLFIQLIVIVLVARACGGLLAKMGQPSVIGEMIAGILLGPSLLGWLLPGTFHFLFIPSSLGVLRLLSQIGVCLFMFVVGMELDVSLLKHQAKTAVMVSQMSILFPYLLGVLMSLFLFTSMAGPKTTFTSFALFVGISMSITAFPVLARILEDRGLTKTQLGSTALICAASNDVMAWSILAVVVAIAKATSVVAAILNVVLVVLFVCLMLFVIKPRLSHWAVSAADGSNAPGKGATAGVLIFIFASALATDLLGIHALFGSFMAGVIMPAHGEFRDYFKVRLEHFSSVFLLPLFFAFTGLRTQIGLLNDPGGWLLCLALVLIATIGKLGGTMFTARLTGVNWLDSFELGALMNTRGLVELIALNIGYDLGILSPRVFAMLVIMALLTTFMTGPLLSFAEFVRMRKTVAVKAV